MRLNKYISGFGICSRREADARIEAGRVTINGQIAALGAQVADGDAVYLDGERIGGAAKKRIYIALNKPVGITCTTQREVEGNIIDFVDHHERIFPIGRLDKDSEGLILLTNDGDIVNEILRAENVHEKEYLVSVDRPVTRIFLDGMASGVRILGTVTKPCKIVQLAPATFRIILTQGLNRQIRRMCSFFGYKVVRLQRVRIINVSLAGLKPGQWRRLSDAEVRGLRSGRRRERLELPGRRLPARDELSAGGEQPKSSAFCVRDPPPRR
ncbi:pseudouridine synthase [Steroidobacter denitrificans]|uniref:Pseudouridine synthase n=1 Tax=Steroidobacter denitrificans TaxID=465721 RepID=A0A127FAS8_STEDE|nr:23S rRNA pseudouridine(2604) synthase RluF [Steroidobacter denitrificans]AMN46700.1 pseudouridine synthase [Steroidobacter denitrificans]